MRSFWRKAGVFFRGERGVTAIESALLLPVLLSFILGIMEAGRLLYTWMVVTNQTREAARWAIGAQQDYLSDGTLNPSLATQVQSYTASRVGALLPSTAQNPTIQVTLSCIDANGGPITCSTSGAILQSVTIATTYEVSPISPFIQPFASAVPVQATVMTNAR